MTVREDNKQNEKKNIRKPNLPSPSSNRVGDKDNFLVMTRFKKPEAKNLELGIWQLLHLVTKTDSKQVTQLDAFLFDELRGKIKALAVQREITLPRLIKNDLRAWVWRFEFLTDLLEPATVHVLRVLSEECSWAIDGGAHVGYMARHFERAGRNCRIFAVEANPLNIEALNANTDPKRTEIIHAALSDRTHSLRLYNGSGHTNSSLSKDVAKGNGKFFEVSAVAVDRLIPKELSSKPGVIKLDVEGFELEAIRGARSVLLRNERTAVVVEINPRALNIRKINPESIFNFLENLGYLGRLIDERFAFGPTGYLPSTRTANYLFLRPKHWDAVFLKLHAQQVDEARTV